MGVFASIDHKIHINFEFKILISLYDDTPEANKKRY